MSNNNNDNHVVVPVGMDIGSLNARVAVSSNDAGERIISNTLGHRSTPTYVTREEDHVVLGEAALRLLQKHKQDVDKHTFYSLLKNENNDLCESFLSHLGSLACDATSVQANQLRIVLSAPPDHAETIMDDSLVECTRLAMRSLIKQAHPKNKKLQKQNVLVGILHHAAAVCVAHGLTDKQNANQSGRILVVDWGSASGMTLTYLEMLGSSKILSIVHTQTDPSLSGFVDMMAKHVATQFERKHKLPTGDVLQNYKARAKLMTACEVAIKSMANSSSSSTVHVTVDGLYEGLDCHVGISQPRWDMLTSSLFKKAKSFLTEFYNANDQPQTVLLAGSVCLLPKVQGLINDIVGNDSYRGNCNIPPDEAVALGCVRHAAQATAIMNTMDNSSSSAWIVPTLQRIPTSPVELGLRKLQDKDTDVLVGLKTPLPAHVTHTFTCRADETYSLWQLTPTEQLLAELENLPVGDEVELLVELDTNGSLALAVQGGEVHRL